MDYWGCAAGGSHSHDAIHCNGVAFSSVFIRVTRMGSHFFRFESKKIIYPKAPKMWFLIGHKTD